MLKKIFTIVIFAALTFVGYASAAPAVTPPVSLSGKIVSNAGSNLWYSSYMNLVPSVDFKQGEVLKIKLIGNAKWVYVRLLPEGVAPTSPTIIVGEKVYVPMGGVVTIKLLNNYPKIQQISVHSGREAFEKIMDPANGNADIASIEVSMEK